VESAVWNGHALIIQGVVVPEPYPPEFRARVVALLRPGKTVPHVAPGLELSDATIYNWRRRDEIDTGVRPGLSSPQAAELASARRRIRELEEEVSFSTGLKRSGSRWCPQKNASL
jgi:transposase